MNYLQLCQRLRQEAAISGAGTPSTVVSQTGEMKKIVDWIETAYEDIQNLHAQWDFLRTDLTFQTIAGQNNYLKTAIGASEYGEWSAESFRCYLTAGGVAAENFMTWVNWTDFRDMYVFGSYRNSAGLPIFISQKPDTSLIVWPKPDAAYTINGEYFKRPQTMSADTDAPLIPQKYHMIIVWRALSYYAGQENAPELFQVAEREYKRLLNQLEASQLPAFALGPALT
jgi:hypothetical protein